MLRRKVSICDGSCLVEQKKSEETKFEDGTSLFFYWCSHERVYVLTNLPGRKYLKPVARMLV